MGNEMNTNQNVTCDNGDSSEECKTDHKSEIEEKPNTLMESLNKWWDSDDFKKLQKENEEAKQRAVGKYFMLSEQDKLDMVQAIFFILCKAEEEGISHRGLMDKLGIYPAGFWILELVDVHNALYEYYYSKRREKELKDDLDSLEDFMKNKVL
jgi:hypothetical protein